MTTIHPEATVTAPGLTRSRALRGRAARFVRGREADPRWVRPSVLGLLVVTTFLYTWTLSESGWANSFYAAAVQAGSESWKAMFFGSSDAANFITVDKPPASLWVMSLSARVFGMNAWSMLVPQALEGVASVGLLYLTVRRRFSPAAGLVAGAVMALTPVAAMMFRFNNPDSLLVLLMVAAAYAVLRAQETASTKWLVWAGVFLGFGFLTKMLQAFVVIPAFALTYLLFAPTGWWRRTWQLLASGAALVAAAGWWILAVELWPASSRPYIGGSQHNSILELTLGYNGLGRLNGDETGSVGGGIRVFEGANGQGVPEGMGAGAPPGGGGGWGETGWDRLFNPENGGQISWLIPAALLMLAAGLWVTRRRKRVDGQRAAFVLWGGWLLTTLVVFSYMKGIFHAYYNVALAPAIGALVGMGGVLLWEKRRSWKAVAALAVAVGVSAWWAYRLLDRTPDWHPWLKWFVVVAGALGVLALLATLRFAGRVVAVAAGGLTLAAVLAAPAAYTAETVTTPHTGSIPTAGPGGMGMGRGGPRMFNAGNGMYGTVVGPGMVIFGNGPGQGADGQGNGQGTQDGQTGGTQGGQGGQGGQPGGRQDGQQGGPGQGGQGNAPQGQGGTPPNGGAPGRNGGQGGGQGGPGGGNGGPGGLLNGSSPGKEVTSLIKKDSSEYTWVAAAIGSNSASGYQLATGKPVMAIGGFNGSDPAPSLADFRKMVADGKIHYFIGSGMGMGGAQMGGSGVSQEISTWVTENFTARTVDGTTLYDLTQPTTAAN
ncbi:glycosyltransferase family 39 protein [Yinghuangia sp. ASG 101]|uniref:ArnT family glycosyltransferase n=1 Tax=Yinghuangia sp. ASG 101 TaxID=2896848 RepID=UPI001E5F961E|nr:glycosyltransferase family 39 protein [Yinghuangia sp. ASG 101]UGQ13720.1 glycosyltransferase family 39 protein [Yinghuangia sp. ASG 101]